MASLRAKIIEYCKDNSVTDVDFTKDVILRNNSDGNGDFIYQWNSLYMVQYQITQ